ncbi:PilN domain-containing protein [Syntrophomonas palmitatica]|uniref:PilN domain-containing protein n=1 Tax=Syntrophomonas palmitatica TaxID=402877 RepID=UPI0006D1E44C|nr:PilN domain-containing protein [Syntrophomonas palmitatica]
METARRIEINLLEVDRSGTRKQTAIIAALLLIIAFTGIMGGMYAVAVNRLAAEKNLNRDLKNRLMKYQQIEVAADNQREVQKQIKDRIHNIEEFDKKRISYIDFLEEIQKTVPEGVCFTQLNIENGKLTINGTASSKQEAARFLSGLRASSWIKDISSATATGGSDPASPITFNIQADWRAAHQ